MSGFSGNRNDGLQLEEKLRQPIRSAPALAAAIRHTHHYVRPHLTPNILSKKQIAPMYRIAASRAEPQLATQSVGERTNNGTHPAGSYADVDDAAIEEEAASAAHVLHALVERLRRLSVAYGEWQEFEVGPYFDLTDAQAERLVRVTERVATVHISFFADLLLPSFQQGEVYWSQKFLPAYQLFRQKLADSVDPGAGVTLFIRERQPRMIAHWQRVNAVIARTRTLIADDIGFLAVNNSEDERSYWRWAWADVPAPGLADELMPPLQNIPTLTLSVDFPLPAARQPNRLRRLRQRRNRRKQKSQSRYGADRRR